MCDLHRSAHACISVKSCYDLSEMLIGERPPATELEPQNNYGEAIFVVGLQYGDEGKGKIVDMLAKDVSVVTRGNGGSNAGHTIVLPNGEVLALHQLPSGVAYEDKLNVIAHGVLVDPVRLNVEMQEARSKGLTINPDNLAISGMAHFVLPVHKEEDASRESGKNAQGSTKAGIAYAESYKRLREGIRVESIATKTEKDIFKIAYNGLRKTKTRRNALGISRPTKSKQAKVLAEEFTSAAEMLRPYLTDTVALLNDKLDAGENVLVEGAQAFGLDIDHGKYPFVTSTSTTVAGLLVGTGINPKRAGKAYGVAKAAPSKVGGGSFVAEIKDQEIAEAIRGTKGAVDAEYGATTGRQREVGYLDLVALKRAIRVNGIDEIALTKFDCLKRAGMITKVVVAYEQTTKVTDRLSVTQRIDVPPSCDDDLRNCTPITIDFPTWFGDQSERAKDYLEFTEKYLDTPITIVSNGPERDQVFTRG